MSANTLLVDVEVYSSDGKKLGRVKHFFSAALEPLDQSAGASAQEFGDGPDQSNTGGKTDVASAIAMDRANATTDAGGIAGGVTVGLGGAPSDAHLPGSGSGVGFGPSDTKYFEVHHGGHLHIGGESLYVPFNAVNFVEDGGTIVLRHTADEAASLYSQKPAELE